MYAAFNLPITPEYSAWLLENYPRSSSNENYNDAARRKLDDLILTNGSLSADEMQKQWFPKIDTNIFISHSHQDEDIAISLANFFKKEFGIESFIDSTVWGYSTNLQKKLDDNYCYNKDNGTYSYKKRNYSTSHVHMILTMALAKMIDKSEVVIFLNTPKSINAGKSLTCRDYEITNSPWIFAELSIISFIERKHPSKHRNYKHTTYSEESLAKSFPSVEYRLSLDEFLIDINVDHLIRWHNSKVSIISRRKKLFSSTELDEQRPYKNLDRLYSLVIGESNTIKLNES